MKNIIIGVCSCVLLGVLILTVYTLHGRNIRQEELDNALAAGMKNAMERVMEENLYAQRRNVQDLSGNEKLVALFLQEFLMQIDSNSQVTVHILDVDCEKGLLSAEAILNYVHPIGRPGTVSSRQTVIVETVSAEKAEGSCCIRYYVNGSRYKAYSIQKGSHIILPGTPVLSGKTFVGWRELNGSDIVSLTGKTVEEDCSFAAVFR